MDSDALLVMLTAIQLRILRMMANGKSIADAGEEIGVSPQSIAKHLEHARKNTGCENNIQLAVVCERAKIL